MSIPFSERPGRHERHYRRRLQNPLFGDDALRRDDRGLLEVQRLDHEELMAFIVELRGTLQRVVELRPNEGSEVILELKEALDRLYETSAGLADEQAGNQGAIAHLLEVIMRNVERGAAGDPDAVQELVQERAARAAHFDLLQHPLVADLLHPHSTVSAAQLAPTLLSAQRDELLAALQLFDLDQLSQLFDDASRCLAQCSAAPQSAAQALTLIAAQLERLRQASTIN